MIAGVYGEVDHVKREVERTVRALKTDAAVRILRRAFEDAGVLPFAATAGTGTGAGLPHAESASRADSLADAMAIEPAESFETLRFRGACELALKMLEQEHRRRRRHASVLLALCAVALLAALGFAGLGLAGLGLAASGAIWGDAAMHVQGGVALLPSAGLGLWYAYAVRLAERVREDLRTLAKVELRA